MLKRNTKIISLIIGIWVFININAHGQITISFNGPNPVPVLENCKTNYIFKKSNFTFTSVGCTVDTSNSEITIIQSDTIVDLGSNINITVQVFAPPCDPKIMTFSVPAGDVSPPTFSTQPTPLTTIECQG
ncbi:MAG: hypothetical protein JNK41_12940, partial [Saprospiraceae bacterium]|nr:hypothetical protein [Saprospiraceae bacterium]